MARRPARKSARKAVRNSARSKRRGKQPPWWFTAGAAVLLAAAGGLGWYWWDMRSWTPDEATYPEQGVAVSEGQGRISFSAVRALGGKFAYLVASSGARGQDARFSRNAAAARDAGLQVGALHLFDPCAPADAQSANFVTMVPRDADMLPAAIVLSQTADTCAERVGDAAVESELMTFINQVEAHTGKSAILRVSPGFETHYHTAATIERNLWVERDRFEPDYVGRPWLLWSANLALTSAASQEPIEWVVVQP